MKTTPAELASNVAAVLPGMFNDPRFKQIDRFRYKALVENVRTGIVIASMNPRFFTYALNQGNTSDLQEAIRSGKLDVGFVVLTQVGNYGKFIFDDAFNVEDTDKKLAGLDLIPGRYGPFWALPASMAANYNAADRWM
jgi:hypothetical protein